MLMMYQIKGKETKHIVGLNSTFHFVQPETGGILLPSDPPDSDLQNLRKQTLLKIKLEIQP